MSLATIPLFRYIFPPKNQGLRLMAKMCDVCGKKPISGNNISHAHNKTRRRWLPNLQNARALVDGRVKRIKVCAACLKSNKVLKAA